MKRKIQKLTQINTLIAVVMISLFSLGMSNAKGATLPVSSENALKTAVLLQEKIKSKINNVFTPKGDSVQTGKRQFKPISELFAKKNNLVISNIPESKATAKKSAVAVAQAGKNTSAKNLKNNPDLHYVLQEVKKRNLPLELAYLPVIESNFQKHAVSKKGAVGYWQFMPATAKQYGLKVGGSADQRKDIKASTQAALTHLSYLHKKFNKDWNLALAAYNAGEGTISKAMQRNRLQGKSTAFWSLKLPKETREYVPKFKAVSKMVGTPKLQGE